MLRKVFSYNGALHTKAEAVSFGLYSSEEIKKISVVKVITPLAFSHLGHALPGGLYDPVMGPYGQGQMCGTCQQTLMYCPGHFGYIELPLPVLNPLFNKTLLHMFRMHCLNCHSSAIPAPIKELSIAQLELLRHGCIQEAQEAELLLNLFLNSDDDRDANPTTPGGKKFKGGKGFKNTENAEMEFRRYIDKILNTDTKKVLKHSTKNIEALKHNVMKRIFSYSKMSQKCPKCGAICKKLTLYEGKLLYSFVEKGFGRSDKMADERAGGDRIVKRYLTPAEAKNHMREIWKSEARLLNHLFPVLSTTKEEFPTDLLFIDMILVPPPKNRPAQTVNNQSVEHPQNIAFRHVVTSCAMLLYSISAIKNGIPSLSSDAQKALKAIKGDTLGEKMETIWSDLQADVDHVMDREKNKSSAAVASQMLGLKQIIEKKEGLFRMNMMGKRVNYAARTVITPDPNIHIEEIGVPDVFAKVLTFPEIVTPWNVMYLRKLVMNGPDNHPGAVAVEGDNGQVTRLDPNDLAKRTGIANRLLASDKAWGVIGKDGVKTVYRHLKNGDYLCLNRQPSLHRPSIMAHRARVLKGEKVFRLHYANCKHYNADFDGDEMNAHFAQSYLAKSEAASLVNVCSHYLVPKDGTPLGGLIQDHVVAGVKLTTRGRFFSKRDYQELVYFALSGYSRKIEIEPPTILKPVQLWSGKQVISTVIKNLVPIGRVPIFLNSTTKIKADEWRQCDAQPWKYGGPIKGDELSDSVFIVRRGELLCGILDKMHLGSTPFGLCHAFHELYGSQAVGALISAFSRLMTNFLQWEGFTLGLKDVLVTRHADKLRRHYMDEAKDIGPTAAATGVGLPPNSDSKLVTEKLEEAHRSPNPKDRAIVDQAYKRELDQYTNKINKCILPYGLLTIFPQNNLQLLVQSGAKGSTVNTMQMSCLLGQIELEGKRPPLTISGKSLPCFKAYDPSPRAGGYIAGRFLTGIRPQEFFFHCMAGREGLIDTAVKTSRSGYLQRCLVKLLEGLVTHYDGTVRDSDGSVVQFLYGEDGLDVCKSQFLKPKHLKFLEANSEKVIDKEVMKEIRKLGNSKEIRREKNKLEEWLNLHSSGKTKPRLGSLLEMCRNTDMKVVDLSNKIVEGQGRSEANVAMINEYLQYREFYDKEYKEKSKRCPDPLVSHLRPDCNFTVVSECLENMVEQYCQQNKVKGTDFKEMIYHKAMKALSCPGDAVGVLAAQSIGEPSTQMTLNTFHFAGRGEMNVTLGIPRLREILMVASAKIKTPSMDVPLLDKVTDDDAERIRLALTRVKLSQVLQHVDMTETVNTESLHRLYEMKFTFLPHVKYREEFCVTPKQILMHFERKFLRNYLMPAIRSVTRMRGGTNIDHSKGKGGRGFGNENGENIDNLESEEAPVDLFKTAQKKGMGEAHESSDEEPEPEDADATQAIRRARHAEAEYDEPEEDEGVQEEGDMENWEEEEKEGREEPGKQVSDDENYDENQDIKPKQIMMVSSHDYRSRVMAVEGMDSLIVGYDFDQYKEEWCTLTIEIPLSMARVNMGSIVREVVEKSIIHQVANISRAFLVRVGERTGLKTEGINILAMPAYRDFLDLNKLYCNNIHTMAERYGIEAASRVIVKEMTDVFKAYGITIDPRHLTLIADYMTFTGTYRPFNRIGIESSASPLQQMSFETVVSFLREAALAGKRDNLQTPSAQIVLGKPARVGTGLFDVCPRV